MLSLRPWSQYPLLGVLEASFEHHRLILEHGGGKSVDPGRWWNMIGWNVCTPAKRKPGTVAESIADLHMQQACPKLFPDSIRCGHATYLLAQYHPAQNGDRHPPDPKDVMRQGFVDLWERCCSSKMASLALEDVAKGSTAGAERHDVT